MHAKLRHTLTTLALGLAFAAPALAEERGSLSGYDDVDYGKTPAAPSWSATVQAPKQDDSKMQPPSPAPGTERKSGVTTSGEYDATRMLPASP